MNAADQDPTLPPAEEGQDRRLIDLYLRGDTLATEQIDRWIDVVLRAQADYLRQDIDDLRQDVRARLFRNLSRADFEGRSSLRTYIHQIAKNACVDHLRDKRRRSMLFDASTPPGVEHPAADDVSRTLAAKDLVERITDGLTRDERRLFALAFVDRCSYSEIARKLGIPEGTVKSRMSRCKDRMLERRRVLLGGSRRRP